MFLEPAVGKANWNIFAMTREGIRHELGSAFRKALERDTPIVVRKLPLEMNGRPHEVSLTVQRLDQPEALRGLVMIMFTDSGAVVPMKSASSLRKSGKRQSAIARQAELERECQQARLQVQTIREEMQSAQEELRSTNEEQQSTNEELQSTNEELLTSKEEMQSMNEELQTLNSELQGKVDELSRSNSDMKNLLNSTDIATLFLDMHLNVRRFTTQTTKLIQLIPGDIGRPITDLASELLYPGLVEDAREVLRKLGFAERPVKTRDGRWFIVRIIPYRTVDDRIDGLVVTFADVTVAKTLETRLRAKNAALKQIVRDQTTEMEDRVPARRNAQAATSGRRTRTKPRAGRSRPRR
jgi:two-component system CheB/CheR fusion protein